MDINTNELREIAEALETMSQNQFNATSDNAVKVAQAAALIDNLTRDLTEANERVTFWMDSHAKDCAELQDIRNHLSLTLAQRNEELLQAKAEATRFREALEWYAKMRMKCNAEYLDGGERARNALEGGE